MSRIKYQSGFGLIGAFAILVVLTVVGFGGWYVWSANQHSASRSDGDSSTTKTFSDVDYLFTFDYPQTWTIRTSPEVLPGQALPAAYSITLETPDIRIGELPIGGTEVVKGAQVIVQVTNSSLKDIHGVFTDLRASAQGKKDVTVAGQAAVQYEYGYESQSGQFFDLLYKNRLYSIGYFSAGNERSSANHAAFVELVDSLHFK